MNGIALKRERFVPLAAVAMLAACNGNGFGPTTAASPASSVTHSFGSFAPTTSETWGVGYIVSRILSDGPDQYSGYSCQPPKIGGTCPGGVVSETPSLNYHDAKPRLQYKDTYARYAVSLISNIGSSLNSGTTTQKSNEKDEIYASAYTAVTTNWLDTLNWTGKKGKKIYVDATLSVKQKANTINCSPSNSDDLSDVVTSVNLSSHSLVIEGMCFDGAFLWFVGGNYNDPGKKIIERFYTYPGGEDFLGGSTVNTTVTQTGNGPNTSALDVMTCFTLRVRTKGAKFTSGSGHHYSTC